MKNNSQLKKVLVVDDEFEVGSALVENLNSLGDNYSIEMVNSSEDALTKIRNERYDLLLTDYKMPGMDGLDLARAVRMSSPDTQVVLMTAYGTVDIRKMVKEQGLGGYIDKPFTMAQIREVVELAVERTLGEDPYPSGECSVEQPLREHLENLQVEVDGACVLLLSASGYPIETVGSDNDLDVTGVGALVAANFVASAALAELLGSNSVFKSSYHEGPEYNIYARDINGELLLAVIFHSVVKPGAVWHYTKQAATTLSTMVEEKPQLVGLAEDLSKATDEEFEQLMGFGDDNGYGGSSSMNLEQTVEEWLVSLELLEKEEQGE